MSACLLVGVWPACSGSPSTGNDASADARPRVCWSGGGTPTEGAEVELGTGPVHFEPLAAEEDLILYHGLQGGAHIFVNARIRGMFTGDPNDVLALNPTTFFSAYRESGEAINLVDCAYPAGYTEGPDGTHELPYSKYLLVKNELMDVIVNERILVRVEVTDPEGRYAMDEQWHRVISDRDLADAGVGGDAGLDAGVDAQ